MLAGLSEQPGPLIPVDWLGSQLGRCLGEFLPAHFPKSKGLGIAVVQHWIDLRPMRDHDKRSVKEPFRLVCRSARPQDQFAAKPFDE